MALAGVVIAEVERVSSPGGGGLQMNGFCLVLRAQLDKRRTGRIGVRVKKKERKWPGENG